MLPTKFLFLKHLTITLTWMVCPSYDYFSLVSFLDGSPSLETCLLDVRHCSFRSAEYLTTLLEPFLILLYDVFCPQVCQERMDHASIFGGSSQLRQIPEQHHDHLKSVKITGFSSAKGLVELTCYILKNTKSLDCLTLDTTYGDPKCDTEMSGGRCIPMSKGFLIEACRGAAAIRTYIEDKVPSIVKLTVVEHCRRCHADKLSNRWDV